MTHYKGTLAELVMARRGMLRISQEELARRAGSGVTKQDISSIERGITGLPGPEKRRGLAAALGSFVAEMLVLANEITPEEIIEGANAYDPQRAKAVSPFPADSPAARLIEIIRTMTDEEIGVIQGVAEDIVNLRQYRESSGPRPKRQVS